MERIDKVIELNGGKKVLLESDFTLNGFRCVILGHSLGHRCGYVAIPKGHKLHGKSYDDLYDLDVHGGLTYSNFTYENYPVESDKETWWLGFDCGHWQDGKDYNLMKLLLDDRSYNALMEVENLFKSSNHNIRSNGYVVTELIALTNQISKL